MSVALVTGSNKGIGFQIVRSLAALSRDGKLKCNLLLAARSEELGRQAVKSLHDEGLKNVEFIRVDLDDEAVIAKAAEEVQSRYGRLDTLINNAGFAFKKEATEPVDVQAERSVAVNYVGTRRVTEAFLPLLKKAPEPRVINVTSSAGLLSNIKSDAVLKALQNPALTVADIDRVKAEYLATAKRGEDALKEAGYPSSQYGMSKALDNAYTRALATAEPGLHVYAMCPGWCKTDMAGDKAPRTAEQGAETAVFLATTPVAELISGAFYKDSKRTEY